MHLFIPDPFMAEILEPFEQAPLVLHCPTAPHARRMSPGVRNERLDVLSDEEWEKFLPLCPDFVLELRSPSDPLRVVQQKMEEYVRTGARLGWLLDARRKQV